MKNLFELTLCAGLLASWATVLAQPVPPPLPGDPQGARPRPATAQKLMPPGLPNVTEQQREPLREYVEAVTKARQETAGRQEKAKRAVADAIFAEKYDEPAIRARIEELSKVEADYQVMRAVAFAKVRPVLTAEQIEVMKSNFDDGMRTRLQSIVNRGQAGPGGFQPLNSNRQPGVPVPLGAPTAGPLPPPPGGAPAPPK